MGFVDTLGQEHELELEEMKRTIVTCKRISILEFKYIIAILAKICFLKILQNKVPMYIIETGKI